MKRHKTAQQGSEMQDNLVNDVTIEDWNPDDSAAEATPDESTPVKDPILENLEQELIQWQNRWALLKADFENYKRRSQRQVEDIRGTANAGLIEEMLPILDNFERALDNAPADSNFAKGVQMIFDQLLQTLCNQGLETIDSVGVPFNPAYHEAVSMEGSGDQGTLVVQSELQKGYMFKEKVLRASMVHVANAESGEEDDNNG